MTLKDELRGVANLVRGVPGELGLRTYRVFLRRETWSGQQPGDGALTVTEVELLENGQPPLVVRANGRQIMLGLLAAGEYTVGPITPAFVSTTTAGGLLAGVLQPANLAPGDSMYVRLVHTDSGADELCTIRVTNDDKPLHWTLIVTPTQKH